MFNTNVLIVIGRTRTTMTPYQTRILMERFQEKRNVDKEEKRWLAFWLNTTERKIKSWFYRKKRLEKQLCTGE